MGSVPKFIGYSSMTIDIYRKLNMHCAVILRNNCPEGPSLLAVKRREDTLQPHTHTHTLSTHYTAAHSGSGGRRKGGLTKRKGEWKGKERDSTT